MANVLWMRKQLHHAGRLSFFQMLGHDSIRMPPQHLFKQTLEVQAIRVLTADVLTDEGHGHLACSWPGKKRGNTYHF